MKKIETIAAGACFAAAAFGKTEEWGEYLFEAGPGMRIPGKVFGGAALGTTGCEFSLQRFAPGTETGFLHTHRHHEELYFVLSGAGEFQVDGTVFPVTEGCVVRVAPPGAGRCATTARSRSRCSACSMRPAVSAPTMPPTASCCWGSRWCGDGRPGRSARSCGGLETRSCAVRGGPGCGPIAEAGRAAADVRTTNEARESRAGLLFASADVAAEQLAPFERGPQGVARPDGTYARRRAGEEQVAHVQGHVARHDGDQPVDREKHVARAAALAHFAVDRQFEPQIPHVAAQLGEGDEGRSDRRRVVEGLRALPRQPPAIASRWRSRAVKSMPSPTSS